jgi:hypothetical protein
VCVRSSSYILLHVLISLGDCVCVCVCVYIHIYMRMFVGVYNIYRCMCSMYMYVCMYAAYIFGMDTHQNVTQRIEFSVI